MTLQVCTFEGDAADTPGLRQALGRFATGVAVIATRTPEGKLEGLTANSFAAVSLDPPLVLWSLRRHAPSLPAFQRSGTFSVNVLSAGQRELSRHFATPSADKFASVAHGPGQGGCPLIEGCLAWLECRIDQTMDGGDHLIFIGRVLRASFAEGEPLIFSAGQYWHTALLGEQVAD
jgi:flavin reductase (DIM6/NTAB) family NADH-FMN oxidoreductase RutF